MKIRRVLWVLAAALATAVPLKTYHLMHSSESAMSDALLIAVIICAVASFVMIAVGLACKKFPHTMPKKRSSILGVIALLTAFATGAESVRAMLLSGGLESLGALGIICNCAGILSSFTFVYLSVCCFKKPKLTENMPLLFALPVVWLALRMLLTYFSYTETRMTLDSYLEIVSLVFLMLFAVSAAKFASGANDNSAKWAFALGGPAVLLVFVQKFSRMLVSDFLGTADVMIALTALSFLICISAKRSKRSEKAPQNERRVQEAAYRSVQRANPAPQYPPMRERSYPENGGHYSYPKEQGRRQEPARTSSVPRYYSNGEDRYTSMGAGLKVAEKFEVRQPAFSQQASHTAEDAPFALGKDAPEVFEKAYLPTPQMYTPSASDALGSFGSLNDLRFGDENIPSAEEAPIERVLDYGESATEQELPKPEPEPQKPAEPEIKPPVETRSVSRASGKLSDRLS